MRIGFGYDIHPLVEDRPMILAGVRIPFSRGLAGHSDADVVAHAIADALLGAAGLGDIGQHFPDTDSRYKDYNSLLFLEEVEKMIHFQKLRIVNIDVSVVLEQPKLSTHKPEMVQNIARHLFIRSEQVNIKATRGEGLGFVGRGEGVICYAIACLEKR